MSKRSPKLTFVSLPSSSASADLWHCSYLEASSPLHRLGTGVVGDHLWLYGYDKIQAKLGGGRVPEIVLHGSPWRAVSSVVGWGCSCSITNTASRSSGECLLSPPSSTASFFICFL